MQTTIKEDVNKVDLVKNYILSQSYQKEFTLLIRLSYLFRLAETALFAGSLITIVAEQKYVKPVEE